MIRLKLNFVLFLVHQFLLELRCSRFCEKSFFDQNFSLRFSPRISSKLFLEITISLTFFPARNLFRIFHKQQIPQIPQATYFKLNTIAYNRFMGLKRLNSSSKLKSTTGRSGHFGTAKRMS